MKTFTHNFNHKGIVLITLAVACVIFIGFMPRINADNATYQIYGTEQGDNYATTYSTQDSEVAYCFDANLAPAAAAGTSFSPQPEEVDKELSYLLLIGYPTTTYINGKEYTAKEAQLITQVAIWIQRGFIDQNGALTIDSDGHFDAAPGEIPNFIKSYGTEVIDSANYMVKEAKEKAPHSDIPAEMRTKLYTPESKVFQRMLVGPTTTWGRIKLDKITNVPESLIANKEYDLTQIEFELYKENNPTGKIFKVSSNKSAVGYKGFDKDNPSHDYIDITPGIYRIVEKNVPSGYKDPEAGKDFYLGAYTGKDSIVQTTVKNEGKLVKIDALIQKTANSDTGATPLEGAEFEVKHIAGDASRTWIVKSDEKGIVKLDSAHLISGDEIYDTDDKGSYLPVGKLVIKEIKAPEGYNLDDKSYTVNLADYAGESTTFSPIKIQNSPIRSDIKFQKKDGNTGQPLPNIPFKLTNTTSGETHIIYTDTEGMFDSTATAHSERTNANDTNASGDSNESAKVQNNTVSGLWFEGTNKENVTDSEGSLPYGTYKLEELRSDTNMGYELISLTFDVKKNGILDLGDLLNYKTGIKTILSADVANDDVFILKDKIIYTNLPEGKEYKVKTSYVVIGDNGEIKPLQIESKEYEQEMTFTPASREGELIVESTIPSKYLKGKTIVAYEEIFLNDEIVTSHKNPNDKDQTYKFEEEKIIHETGIPQNNMFIYVVILAICLISLVIILKPRRDVW